MRIFKPLFIRYYDDIRILAYASPPRDFFITLLCRFTDLHYIEMTSVPYLALKRYCNGFKNKSDANLPTGKRVGMGCSILYPYKRVDELFQGVFQGKFPGALRKIFGYFQGVLLRLFFFQEVR